jgi:hypothetical protein
MKLLGITSVGFVVADKLLIKCSGFVRYWRKMGVQKLFVDCNNAYDSVRREVLHIIHIELWVNRK